MGLFSVAAASSLAGSATIPQMSLYAPAGNRLILREVPVYNTTATAVNVALQALTSTGTQGVALTEIEHDNEGPTPTGTGFQAHTAGPTITTGEYARARLAAAIGGAAIWIFNEGIYIPAGTANGVGVTTPTGTGQVCDITFIWEE